jgi:hypothetical protein
MLQHVSLCSGHRLAGLASYRMRDNGNVCCYPCCAVLSVHSLRPLQRCMLCATRTLSHAKNKSPLASSDHSGLTLPVVNTRSVRSKCSTPPAAE